MKESGLDAIWMNDYIAKRPDFQIPTNLEDFSASNSASSSRDDAESEGEQGDSEEDVTSTEIFVEEDSPRLVIVPTPDLDMTKRLFTQSVVVKPINGSSSSGGSSIGSRGPAVATNKRAANRSRDPQGHAVMSLLTIRSPKNVAKRFWALGFTHLNRGTHSVSFKLIMADTYFIPKVRSWCYLPTGLP